MTAEHEGTFDSHPRPEGFEEEDRAFLAGLVQERVLRSRRGLFHESTPRQWYGIVASGEVGPAGGAPWRGETPGHSTGGRL